MLLDTTPTFAPRMEFAESQGSTSALAAGTDGHATLGPCADCEAQCNELPCVPCGLIPPPDLCFDCSKDPCMTGCTLAIVPCDEECQDACYDDACATGWSEQSGSFVDTSICDVCPVEPNCCSTLAGTCTEIPCTAFPPSHPTGFLPTYNEQFIQNFHSMYPFPAYFHALPSQTMCTPHGYSGPVAHPYTYPYPYPSSSTPSLTSGVSTQGSAPPTPPHTAQQGGTLSWTCEWRNCPCAFSSLEELKRHVDKQHFHLPGVECGHAWPPVNTPSDNIVTQYADAVALINFLNQNGITECLWGSCGSVPALPANMEPSGLANATALATHLLHNHLHEHENQYEFAMDPSLDNHHMATAAHDMSENSATSQSDFSGRISLSPRRISSSIQLRASSSTSVEYSCGWEDCTKAFDGTANLTEHVMAVHIGSGKNSYPCGWVGCERSEEGRAFGSKQKILRHLQSHTGHRPYKCEICHEHFSETATLQQHKRRHTQEKPFVCDYPGCGKAFAITGALTIHKRTHNGEKPFKCTYCDRAFAESSNFTKHLRTHTGNKPYLCPEPDCGKRFSRPDQLSRHANVHRKPSTNRSSETDDSRGKYGD